MVPGPSAAHRYVDLGEVRLHYVEAGEGPLVVLLHGFPEFWYSWRFQISALAGAGFRVVAPDMRGYNLSDKPEGVKNYGLDLLARDVERLVGALGERRAVVVRHDWAGMVAWAVAMLHPGRVARLAILNVPHPERFSRAAHPAPAPQGLLSATFQGPLAPPKRPSGRENSPPCAPTSATTRYDREHSAKGTSTGTSRRSRARGLSRPP